MKSSRAKQPKDTIISDEYVYTHAAPLKLGGGGGGGEERGMSIYMYPGGSTSLSVSNPGEDPLHVREIYCTYPEVVSFVLWTLVTHPLFISFHAFPVGNCPLHMRSISGTTIGSPVDYQVEVRSRVRSTDQKPDAKKTGNARVPTKTHAQRTITVQPADAFGRWCPFQVLSMPKSFHRIKRTSPDKERSRRTRNGQETHANGYERIAKFSVRWTTVNAIR